MTLGPVLHSFAYALDYLRDQVADLSAGQMVAQPSGVVNHPAWTIGHLVYSCQLLAEVAGVEGWLPGDWGGRFGTGSVPVADVAAYEGKEKLLERLREAQAKVVEAVEKLADAQLDAVFPEEGLRAVFPTVRHALTQVMVGHTAHHVGQIASWRRAMGLPGIGRGFE